MLRIGTLIAMLAGLLGCTSPDYINLVHPEHRPELQRVNTPEKAMAFFADTTYVFRSGNGLILPVENADGTQTFPSPQLRVEYYAADQTIYVATESGTRVTRGRWSLKQSGRGYPRLCRSFPIPSQTGETIMTELDCFWPNLLFKRYPPTNGLYRGDVLNLKSGRMPVAFRSRQSETTLSTLFARQGINTATLIDLKYSD